MKRTVKSDIKKLIEKYGIDEVVRSAIDAKAETATGLNPRALGINPRALRFSSRLLRLREEISDK